MKRYTAPVLLASLALLSPNRLTAQEPAAPETAAEMGSQPLVRIRATGVQELVKAWPSTKIGKLMADEDVVDAATTVLASTKNYLHRQRAVRDSFTQLSLLDDMEPWEVANLYGNGDDDLQNLLRYPAEQVTRAELTVRLPNGVRTSQPSFVTSLSCAPRYEGRWTQAFEKDAEKFRASALFEEIQGSKIDGFPAYAFQAPKSVTGDAFADNQQYARWMLHMPGTFVYGNGQTKTAVTKPDDSQRAEVSMELDLDAYVAMFQRMGMGIPPSFAVLGFDNLKTLKWSGRFRGELIEDRLDLELTDTPSGLVAALLTGTAKLPAQALPKGAIAQLRSSVNTQAIATLLPILADGSDLPEELVNECVKAFDGGIAISCCAPAPGGVIPRIFVSLGIADETALDGLLKQFLTDNLPTKQVKYGGVACTVIKVPDMPNGIQPAFCRVNGTLHIAESALSLRAFLKVQGEDTVAMDVEDAPEAGGAGDLVSTFDWRFDEVQLYKCFYQDWLPLYELTGMANDSPVRRKDMPEPDVVEMYCGKSRGVLRKDGNKFSIVMLGALGGPELAALAMTWGPMIAGQMRDYQTDNLTIRLARHKLDTVHEAVVAFHKREKRMPKDLAELFTAQKLNDDALLLPGDDLAEEFAMPDGRKLKSSFRYFAKPVTFASQNGDGGDTILIEIRTRPYNRLSMTSMGVVPDAYGPDSQKPIDQFGKGGSGTSSAGESTGRASTGGHNHK
tara:strand:- start:1498 stop:3690 length:2193 start_codon:yes stop_codon:yes gene_type:complete